MNVSTLKGIRLEVDISVASVVNGITENARARLLAAAERPRSVRHCGVRSFVTSQTNTVGILWCQTAAILWARKTS